MKSSEGWSYCLDFFYDSRYAKNLSEFLASKKAHKILDASCGVGFPAIELAKAGFEVVCSDGSGEMLEVAKKRAAEEAVKIPFHLLKWKELGSRFSNAFDVVMCRGNSLPYANSWEGNSMTTRADIEEAIQNFFASAKPGGYFYTDITHEKEFRVRGNFVINFPEKTIRGKKVKMIFNTSNDLVKKTRVWTPKFTVDGEEKSYTVKGYLLEHDELVDLIEKAGFEKPERTVIDGEEHYNVYVARKPEN